jgi:hypothetical protein
MPTIQLLETYSTILCSNCGVSFALSEAYIRARREDHKTWYCPNGCTRFYPEKSDLEKAQVRIKALESDLSLEQGRLTTTRNKLNRERRSHASTKGQLTKVRKRADHAMCPVDGCRRSFANVARHIERQHPGYVA